MKLLDYQKKNYYDLTKFAFKAKTLKIEDMTMKRFRMSNNTSILFASKNKKKFK